MIEFISTSCLIDGANPKNKHVEIRTLVHEFTQYCWTKEVTTKIYYSSSLYEFNL